MLSRVAASALPSLQRRFSRGAGTVVAAGSHPVLVKTESRGGYVFDVVLSRPDKRNAFDGAVLAQLETAFARLGVEPDCRAVVLSGDGPCFTAGVDLSFLLGLSSVVADEDLDVARKAARLRPFILDFQRCVKAPVLCPRPVIAAVHGACVGAGVDLVCGADIRLCSADAWFQVKEVDVGLAADVGTLARLTKIVGSESWAREVALTARRVGAEEALARGLVSGVFPDRAALLDGAGAMARAVAEKSPVAVQGTKLNMEYALNHTTDESLDYISVWNMSMLMSEDLVRAAAAQMDRDPDGEKPTFAKL